MLFSWTAQKGAKIDKARKSIPDAVRAKKVLSMARKERKSSICHPALKELDLSAVSPLEVLNQLLEQNHVSADVVRQVHSELVSGTKAGQQEIKEKSVNSSSQGDSSSSSPSRRTRHIALRFYYDGGNYSGLAQNIGQDNDNSVEKALFQALLKARLIDSRETCGYSRCGRTDKGVSSAGQVVAMQLKSAIPMDASYDSEGVSPVPSKDLPRNEIDTVKVWVPPKSKKNKNKKKTSSSTPIDEPKASQSDRQEKEMTEYHYAKILNNLLPAEIRILGWTPVSDEFSARFSATTRVYRYFFVPRQMNLDRMTVGLNRLVGTHDFRNFCKMDVEKVYNFERVIHDAKIVNQTDGKDGCAYVQIVGQAFLWHQIRCIMEVMFMIGRGLEAPSVVDELLNVTEHPGKPSYALAPERPLVLHDCKYSNLLIGYSVPNLWNVTCHLESQWEELTLAAARIRNTIESLKSYSVLQEDLELFASRKLSERAKKRLKTSHHKEEQTALLTADSSTSSAEVSNSSSSLTWDEAVKFLVNRGLHPDPHGLDTRVHIPLLQRSMGTTYEEKLEALQKSDRRRVRYEENVIQKRKTKEEDQAFYKDKIKQGSVE